MYIYIYVLPINYFKLISYMNLVSSTTVPRGGQRITLWEEEHVSALLDAIFENHQALNDKVTKKKTVWQNITKQMNNVSHF